MGRSKRAKNRQKEMRHAKKNSSNYKEKAKIKLSKRNKMEKRYLIGIYDSFRRKGKFNINFITTESKLIGSFSTLPIYSMYDVDQDDCIIVEGGNCSIKMEVWELTESALNVLERNYSYYEELRDEDNIYLKKEINSPFGIISIFIYNEVYGTSNPVEDGDWIEHVNYEKVMGKKNKIEKTQIQNLFNSSDNFNYADKEFMD